MANSYTLLADLRAGRCSNTVEVRLLRQTYRQDFNEGFIYSLSGFDVTRSNNNFRLSDALVSIRFGEGIRFTQVTDSDKVIPTEMFRFRSYDQLLALTNTNRQLP
ncbi:unnamed protein product, partial [Brassica oleracea var. botrytis]